MFYKERERFFVLFAIENIEYLCVNVFFCLTFGLCQDLKHDKNDINNNNDYNNTSKFIFIYLY